MTTLDPRALEAATEAVGRHIHYSRPSHNCHRCRSTADAAITAYLAVTQPVVETVEELEGLEVGAVVLDSHQEELVNLPEGWYCIAHNEMALPHEDIALPARVIWRPHENP